MIQMFYVICNYVTFVTNSHNHYNDVLHRKIFKQQNRKMQSDTNQFDFVWEYDRLQSRYIDGLTGFYVFCPSYST